MQIAIKIICKFIFSSSARASDVFIKTKSSFECIAGARCAVQFERQTTNSICESINYGAIAAVAPENLNVPQTTAAAATAVRRDQMANGEFIARSQSILPAERCEKTKKEKREDK